MPVELIAKTDDTLTLANVMSGGQHGTLVLHPGDLISTIFQLEKFDPKWIAAHTQLRLSFKKDSLKWYKDPARAARANATPDQADLAQEPRVHRRPTPGLVLLLSLIHI